jgi:hypothetical protein
MRMKMNNWELKFSIIKDEVAEDDETAVNQAEKWLEDLFGPLIFNYVTLDNIWKVSK